MGIRPLGGTLLSLINLFYYQDLMAGVRAAIRGGRFANFLDETKEQWVAKRDLHADDVWEKRNRDI